MAKDRPPEHAAAAHAPASQPGRLARAVAPLGAAASWIRRSKLRMGAALAGSAACMIGLGLTLTLVFRAPDESKRGERLAAALEKLDAGERREARSLAVKLSNDKTLPYAEHGGPLFILGATTFGEAEEQVDPTKRRLLLLVASRY
jgi:hypothetical protein